MSRTAEVIYVGDAASLIRASEQAKAAVAGTTAGIAASGKKAEASYLSMSGAGKKAAQEMESVGGRIGKSLAGIASSGNLAVAGLAAVAGAVDIVKHSADTLDELGNTTLRLHNLTGLTIESASKYAAVAKVQEIPVKGLTMAFITLSKNAQAVVNAQDGLTKSAKTQENAFKLLKLPLSDVTEAHGNLNKLLPEIITKFEHLPGSINKAAIAQALFGRGAQALVPLMHAGALGLKEQLDVADKMGATIGGKSVTSLKQFAKAQEEAKYASLGLQLAIGQYVAPALTTLITDFAGAVSSIRSGSGSIAKAAQVIGDAFQVASKLLAPIIHGIGALVSGMATTVGGAVHTIKGLLTLNFSEAWAGVKQIFAGGIHAAVGLLVAATAPFQGAAKAAFGAITSAASGAFHTLEGFFNKLYDIGKFLITGLVKGIEAGAGAVKSAVKSIIEAPIKLGEEILEAKSPSKVFHRMGQNVSEGFAQGIEAGQSRAHDAVKGLMSSTAAVAGGHGSVGSVSGGASPEGELNKIWTAMKALGALPNGARKPSVVVDPGTGKDYVDPAQRNVIHVSNLERFLLTDPHAENKREQVAIDNAHTNLIHELAHTMQRGLGTKYELAHGVQRGLGSKWEAEGGAQAYADQWSPKVFGDGYQNHGDYNYAGFVKRVRRQKGGQWIDGGQFEGTGSAGARRLMAPGTGGFSAAPGTNYKVGEESTIAKRLRELGEYLHVKLTGISGYRTPKHSVEVGGFANDPHTRGEASDTEGAQKIAESVLEKFGLTRPFAGAKEADHIQLLAGGAAAAVHAGATKTHQSSVLASLNHVFKSGVQLSKKQIEAVANWAGLDPHAFAQIAKGESSDMPGEIEPTERTGIGGVPVKGYGLWQMTTGVGNDALIKQFGGTQAMLNPLTNARAARALLDKAKKEHARFPWFGTKYLTASIAEAERTHAAGGELSATAAPHKEPGLMLTAAQIGLISRLGSGASSAHAQAASRAAGASSVGEAWQSRRPLQMARRKPLSTSQGAHEQTLIDEQDVETAKAQKRYYQREVQALAKEAAAWSKIRDNYRKVARHAKGKAKKEALNKAAEYAGKVQTARDEAKALGGTIISTETAIAEAETALNVTLPEELAQAGADAAAKVAEGQSNDLSAYSAANSKVDAELRAGLITEDQAKAAKIANAQKALAGGYGALSEEGILQVKGDLKEFAEAVTQATNALENHTKALEESAKVLKEFNQESTGLAQVESGVLAKGLADLVSGQIGGRPQVRGAGRGAPSGSAARY